MKKNDLEKFRKISGIKYPIVAVSFVDKIPNNYKACKDTVCTALARTFLKKRVTYFNGTTHRQLCHGADYFFKFANVGSKEAVKNYVDEERIFSDETVCRKFLKNVPKFPKKLQGKAVVIKPLGADDNPSVIVLLLTPAQAGRIVGLLNYDAVDEIKILPSQSTCISLFAPLTDNKIHLNLIDYYDRYYQGIVGKKQIWPDDCMIVSVTLKQFCKIIANIQKSSHGSFVPKILPQKVNKF